MRALHKKCSIHSKIACIWLAAILALSSMLFISGDSFAATFPVNFDETYVRSWDPDDPLANEWQIISKSFPGMYTGADVSQGWDTDSNASYSIGDGSTGDVRMTNSVLSTDVENEFMMYTCIEPRVSWTDILRLNTILATNNKGNRDVPQWPKGGNDPSYLVPEKGGAYQTSVKVRYFVIVNGQKKYLTDVITMYTSANSVPNGSVGIGNPILSDPSDGTFAYLRGFDLYPGSSNVAEIQIPDEVYKRFEFCDAPVYAKTYTANLADNVDIYTDITDIKDFNFDGDSKDPQNDPSIILSNDNKTLTWKLPEKDLGVLDYEIKNVTVNGETIQMTVPKGVLRSLENGKITYYRQEAYQMTYRFSLDVTGDGFTSCGDGTKTSDTTADFAVQVSSASDNSAKGAKLTYTYGPLPGQTQGTGEQKTGYLNPNFVKGLLYDLKFQKVIKDSSIPLNGVKFKLTRTAGDGSGTKSDTRQYTFKHDGEDPNVEITESDGSIRFKNMPWGYYNLEEISLNGSDSFQQDYLVNAEQGKLPKGIPALDSMATGTNAGTAAVGWVIRGNNSDGKLVKNGGDKLADQGCNPDYQMYVFQPNEFNRREGFVENEPYWTEITVKKKIDKYDQLADSLKNTEFDIKTKGDEATYKYPSLADTTKTLFGENTASLKHGEQVTYKVMIPKDGADIDINELLSGTAKKSFAYKLTTVTGNKGAVTNNKTGVKVHAIPGYSAATTAFTAEITNSPVTKLYIKKVIDNYQSELENDEFMINVSNQSGSIDSDVVLKHNETTNAAIVITEAGTVNIDEIMPQEYQWVKNEVAAGNATVSGHDVSLDLGEEVTIAVHNKYNWQPYFHDFDTKANKFNKNNG